jgi:N-acetylglucosaminyldiphosphoundecaprenol N-acetyl-beta-D-mannosaminyltransferase
MGGVIMRDRKRPFGLTLSKDSAREIAGAATRIRRRPEDGIGLVVTPNIDHIAIIRRSAAMARAYQNAERIVCDGWPVQLYARLCGDRLSRVTGCEITSELMRMAPYASWQRFFFVVDTETTADAVRQWAKRNHLADGCATIIPPFGFDQDAAFCSAMAGAIAAHGTTVLIMAVGAPRSEVFVDTYRAMLPPCWAFCVGQAVKIELGLVQRASHGWQSVGMEWLWRLIQEPQRLARRYASATYGFSAAVIEDQVLGGLRTVGPGR